jgi:uncharacterized protein YeaO (DUF488 family)
MTEIRLKRIYEPFVKSDGYRVLVDRLWPRGMKKEKAHVDQWMKEAGPSNELRKWFDHDPEKWKSFQVKYHKELRKSEAFKELMNLVAEHKVITLLYSAKDEEHNQAVALKGFIDSH